MSSKTGNYCFSVDNIHTVTNTMAQNHLHVAYDSFYYNTMQVLERLFIYLFVRCCFSITNIQAKRNMAHYVIYPNRKSHIVLFNKCCLIQILQYWLSRGLVTVKGHIQFNWTKLECLEVTKSTPCLKDVLQHSKADKYVYTKVLISFLQ